MLVTLYSLSGLALLTATSSLLISQYSSKFEGGAGLASCFVFLIGAILSIIVSIILLNHWVEFDLKAKIIGSIGTLPLFVVLLLLGYVMVQP